MPPGRSPHRLICGCSLVITLMPYYLISAGREQLNQISAWIDASHTYGSTDAEVARMRAINDNSTSISIVLSRVNLNSPYT